MPGIYQRMVRVRKMTKEARMICKGNVRIVSFFTFPLYMEFTGKTEFGHSAFKKLEPAIAYLGYQMKYHKKGDDLVGLANTDNTRACVAPLNSQEFDNALGTLFGMPFIKSGLIDKIAKYCQIASQHESGAQPTLEVQTAQRIGAGMANVVVTHNGNIAEMTSETLAAVFKT